MRRGYRFKALTLFALLGLFVLSSDRSSGQLLLASGEYRVVDIDQDNLRVGVALMESSPDKLDLSDCQNNYQQASLKR